MSDELQPVQPGNMQDKALPESAESDPKAETIMSRSQTLKRMISAFQTPEEAGSTFDAALDVDRSVEPALPANSGKDPADALEKTIATSPALEATILSPSSVKRSTGEMARLSDPASSSTPEPQPVSPADVHPVAPKVDEAAKSSSATAGSEAAKPGGIVPAKPPTPKVIDAASVMSRPENALTGSPDEAPWTLQQFFNGEIDLDVELSKRFPTMPMLSIIKFRTLGSNSSRRVATLATQDGAASLTVDADVATKVIQLSFTLGSMLTLRFAMTDLSDMDRNRWLELMRRDQGGLAFLWGPPRWAQDYMICISRKYFTNLYAFSPHNFEAGVRLTPAVTRQLLDWIEELWKAQFKQDDESPPLLTW